MAKDSQRSKTIKKVPLAQIEILTNYRKPKQIEKMAFSLVSEGQAQPIVVRKGREGKFVIITGARRYEGMLYANKTLGGAFETIDAIVIESKLSKEEEDLMQLILNESMDSNLEKAIKIVELAEGGMKQERLAEAFGYKQAYISMLKKKIVPNKVFRQYISNEKILLIEDKKNNKKYFGSEFSDFQSILTDDPALAKTIKDLKPKSDEQVKLASLDHISEVYYKLEELNRIDLFNEMIVHLQQKQIYDSAKIESLCKKTLKSIDEKLVKKNVEKEKQDPVETSFKIFKTISKYEWTDDLINQINNIFNEKEVPLIISKKG